MVRYNAMMKNGKEAKRLKQLEQNKLRKIGQRLYDCRREKGWSQSYVAEKIDVSINTISSIENGAQQFNLAILLQFSMLYDVSADYILTGKKQEMNDFELIEKIRRIPVMERKRVMAALEAFYA